jgi:signal transduction histidine kinase
VAPQPTGTLEEQVGRLQSQLDLLKTQVRQAQQLAALGTAAAMIAHEVNNLLTPILSYAQAALDANDPDLQKKALNVAVKNVRMLVAMSDRVLEISAAKPPTREPVCVRTVVQDAVVSLCRDLSKDGIRLAIDVDDSIVAQTDSLQLQQVLFNLFLNAREVLAARHNGYLGVSAERQGDRVAIKVRNTGDPIPRDLLPHVFEPFQTSKPALRDGRRRCGGLGLALCRDLVEENDGTITVASDAETGTTFTITLPAARSARP